MKFELMYKCRACEVTHRKYLDSVSDINTTLIDICDQEYELYDVHMCNLNMAGISDLIGVVKNNC